MSTTSTQYLLYASLLLGSIGTYNALKDGMAPGAIQGDGTSASSITLENDIAGLSGSMRAVESFVDSFNNKSTSLHAELADVHSALKTLSSLESSDGSAVDVDSKYVKNLSKRISLVETSNTSSKEAAFYARDISEANKANLEGLKSLVDSVTQQISSTRETSGQVAQLAKDVRSGKGRNHDFTAMESRVNGLTTESEELARRLVGVETWMEGRKSASVNVTAADGSAAVSQATLDNIADLQSSVDVNSSNISTLITDVNINTDDISTMNTELQEQISQNKSDTSAVKLKADGLVSDMDTLHLPRIAGIEATLSTLTETDTTTSTRLELVEAEVPLAQAARGILTDDLVALSERVTQNTNSIGDIEDDLDDVIQEDIDAAKARITALEGDASHLSEKLKRSGDEIICDGLLRTQEAKLSLNKHPLRLAGSSSSSWILWAGDKMTFGGKQSPSAYGFGNNATDTTLRMRVASGSANGFVLENTNATNLFSVRGSDGLGYIHGAMRVDDRAYVSGDSSTAYFSNILMRSKEQCALAQTNDGTTTLNSPKDVKLRVNKKDRLHVKQDGNNVISAGGKDKTTGFAFGDATEGRSMVQISQTDILIGDGKYYPKVYVKSNIQSLWRAVRAIQKDYVKSGDKVVIRNHLSKKYLDSKGSATLNEKNRTKNDAHYSIILD